MVFIFDHFKLLNEEEEEELIAEEKTSTIIGENNGSYPRILQSVPIILRHTLETIFGGAVVLVEGILKC